MIASPNYSQRAGGRKVSLVIVHTAQGARNVESLGAYFANAGNQVSSHVGIDDRTVMQYVPYSMAAWTAGGANSISDQAELCGFAEWTREQWIGEHRHMLELTAAWVRERCLARGIPIRKLTPAQVAAGESGVCGHGDWSSAMNDGNHWDPGEFAWDVVMSLAGGGTAPPSPSAVPPLARPHAKDEPCMNIPITIAPDGSFRGGCIAEEGSSSRYIAEATIVFGVMFGSADVYIQFLGADGLGMGPSSGIRERVGQNGTVALDAPDGAKLVSVEGQLFGTGVVPTAALLVRPK